MATSVPSERLFSVAGEIVPEKIGRLSYENMRVLSLLGWYDSVSFFFFFNIEMFNTGIFFK